MLSQGIKRAETELELTNRFKMKSMRVNMMKTEKLNKMMKLETLESKSTKDTRSSFKLQISIATSSGIQKVLLSCTPKRGQLMSTWRSSEVEKDFDNHKIQISLLLQLLQSQCQLLILLWHQFLLHQNQAPRENNTPIKRQLQLQHLPEQAR